MRKKGNCIDCIDCTSIFLYTPIMHYIILYTL